MKEIIISTFLLSSLLLGNFYPTPVSFFSEKNIEIYSQQIKKIKQINKNKEPPLYIKDFSEVKGRLISEKKDFVMANLGEMEINFYREGNLIKEMSVFKKGDPQNWGGTPFGLYKIIEKHKVDYSTPTNTYMPWSIHFYGKYYIHGENYYPGGVKANQPITGGCIQLQDQDAKVFYDLIETGMPILIVDKGLENDGYKYSPGELTEFPKLTAKSYLVADLESGLVFAGKDYQKKLPISSVAKLMTAVTVAENIDLSRAITATSKMLVQPEGTEGLTAGKRFQVFELFWPLLIESSDDAAEVLSYFLGREKTIQLMNEKAEAISMVDTEFVDSSGLNQKNVSTAQDLFNLARYILNSRPMFLNISRGEKVWTFDFPVDFKNLENKNIFFENPDFLGGKTGSLQADQSAGLFIFRFKLKDEQERKVVIILLDSGVSDVSQLNIKNDANKVLDWLKENYFKETQ